MAHPANRAARRAFARKKGSRKVDAGCSRPVFESKNWKQIYLHRNKLTRAKQLGMLWPYPKQLMEELLLETGTDCDVQCQ